MVHQTFYNLEAEKRNRIIEAARAEFSKGPFSNARISNIVAGAEIPRGSFYQYFDTMEDVLDALWEDIREQKRTFFNKVIEKAEGDIFSAALLIFDGEYDFFSKQENQILAENLSGYMLTVIPISENSFFNTAHFKADNPLFLQDLLTIISNCLMENIRTGIKTGTQKQQMVETVRRQLTIIRYGAEQ